MMLANLIMLMIMMMLLFYSMLVQMIGRSDKVWCRLRSNMFCLCGGGTYYWYK
jgi:hypothetical protein